MVDARDLKSLGAKSLYEFDSRPRHHRMDIKSMGYAYSITPFLFLLKTK
jgi:hypothetical protein